MAILITMEIQMVRWVTPFEQDPNVATTHLFWLQQIYGNPLMQGIIGLLYHKILVALQTILKIAPSDSNTMYAAFGSNLYKTTNGGSNGDWVQQTGFSGNINSIAIHPTNSNKLAIATNSSR